MKRTTLLVGLLVCSFVMLARAQQVTTGFNNNMTGCISDEYICDPYLRQKVETTGACSALNGDHCLFAANDYSGIKASSGDGTGESGTLNETLDTLARLFGRQAKDRIAAIPDAWIGLYRCYRGPEGVCVNGLWPGFPSDTSTLGTSGPEYGFGAGSDPACAADDSGGIGCIGMFINRPASSSGPVNGVIATRFFRDYNDESRNPIRLDTSIPPSVLVQGSSTAGKFADLPVLFFDVTNHLWIAGWTQFHRDGAHIWATWSKDGKTWTIPENISNPFGPVQRVVFASDKRPVAQGGGNIYALFRTFSPDAFGFAVLPSGADKFSPPVNITAKSGPSESLCAYDAPSRGSNEQPDPLKQFARSRDFASIDTDSSGNIYVVHTERLGADGSLLSSTDCGLAGIGASARVGIVISKSSNGGQTFSTRKPIDLGDRCETAPAPNTPPADITTPNVPCPTSAISRPAGVQMQAVLKITGGNALVTYREGRGGINTPDGYFGGRPARMDVRAAKIDISSSAPALQATRQVSQYEYDPATGDYASRTVPSPSGGTMTVQPEANAPGADKKTSLTFLPLHQIGTTPFMGDYNGLVAMEEQVSEPSGNYPGAHWATAADVPSLRMVSIWGGDTRETGFPLDTTTGLPSIFGPWPNFTAAIGPGCVNPTARFSNVFASVVSGPVEAWAVQTFKPLGKIQRDFPIVIRNRGNQLGRYRLTLVAKDGFRASFDQRQTAPEVRVLGTTLDDGTCPGGGCTPLLNIPPGSSTSVSVFGSQGSALDVRVPSPIKVLVDDVTTADVNPDAIIRLNPNPIQYDLGSLVGDGIDVVERHGRPVVSGPFVTNKSGALSSPSGGNPTYGSPTFGSPTYGSSTLVESTDIQFVVTTGSTPNTTSGYEAVSNFADAFLMDDKKCGQNLNQPCHEVETIVSRTHTLPTVQGCTPALRNTDEVIAYNPFGATPTYGSPTYGSPTYGSPTYGSPTYGSPTYGSPTYGSPTFGSTTFTLSPSSAPLAGVQASMAVARKSLASARPTLFLATAGPDGTIVGDPPTDAVLVTFRVVHNHGAETLETSPRTKAQAEDTVGFVAIPEAEDNKAGGLKPLAANDNYSTTQGTVLTIPAPGVLLNDIGVIDDANGNTVPLTAQLATAPLNGTVTLLPNGSFTYKPKGSFVGLDRFQYRAIEGSYSSPRGTVWINVLVKK